MTVDPDLVVFVRDHVRSVWALELLLLLRREPERCWPPADLVRELRASQMLVSDNLRRLVDGGLVIIEDADCYRYRPASPVLDGLCAQLDVAYRERPVAVVNMIAKPTGAVQSLADAFKFRGETK